MSDLGAKFISVTEDCIESYVFSLKCTTNVTYWHHLQRHIQDVIEKLSASYIWHKDKFQVYVPIQSLTTSDELPEHLHSSTQFGDNIEDEWFIVHLIMEITKAYHDIIVQVNDNDGEFLLIEAADLLPDWVNPGNTENRVYIHQGHIHIIPPDIIGLDKKICVKDAINIIAKHSNQTKSSYEINNSIIKRMGKYPEKHQENIHRAIIEIPVSLAATLMVKPSLISAIIDAYCNRDIHDTKLCQKVEYKETVDTTVTFTKCLYAMLIHSKAIGKLQNKIKKVDLGFKLTVGYQILLARSSDVFSSKQWITFLCNLENTGYFQGNLEGSQEYVQLLQKAKKYFMSCECPSNVGVANEIKEIENSYEHRHQHEQLLKEKPELIDESDDWLNIQPQHLEDLLNSRYGKQAKYHEKEIITPQVISNELSKFLKQSSDFEGIEVNNTTENEDNSINFDAELFGDAIKDILDSIENGHIYNVDSDMESSGDDDFDFENTTQDIELKKSLLGLSEESNFPKNTLTNFAQSIKEEGSSSGPSSILLKNIGLHKTEILDSDDDDSAVN